MQLNAGVLPGGSKPSRGVDIGIVFFQKVNNSWESSKLNKVQFHMDLHAVFSENSIHI